VHAAAARAARMHLLVVDDASADGDASPESSFSSAPSALPLGASASLESILGTMLGILRV